jgi:phage gp36-like protein
MKPKQKLTLEQHQQFAAYLRDPILMRMCCDIPNTYGTTSKVGKQAHKLYEITRRLISDMDNIAWNEGYTGSDADLYYPNATPTMSFPGTFYPIK